MVRVLAAIGVAILLLGGMAFYFMAASPPAGSRPSEAIERASVGATAPSPLETEPVSASEPEPVSASEPEPVSASEPEPVSDSESEPVSASEPEPVSASEPEPVSASEPEPVSASEPEPSLDPVGAQPSQSAEPTSAAQAPEPRPTRLPDFPWPPPEPSASLRLTRSPFDAASTLKDVSEILIRALREADHWQYSFYRAPGLGADGFALITRLEHIGEDGSRLAEETRFKSPDEDEPFTIGGYIQALFFAPEGHYRLIVFVVTDRTFTATGEAIGAEKAARLLREGTNTLPREYRAFPFSEDHGVDALIYEFHKARADGEATLLRPGRLGAHVHLTKAELSSGLGLSD